MEKIDKAVGEFKVCVDAPGHPPCHLLSKEDLKEKTEERLRVITEEFRQTFDFIQKYPRSVSFFGSARFPEDHAYYKKAERIASKLCQEGYAVISGGGPGIMEGANKGAFETCRHSIGFNIQLPTEQKINKYVTDGLGYKYFFSRKVALAFSAEAFIFFPGGFGTLDEFFEMITLMQTKKIQRIPVICVGSHYWGKLQDFIEEVLYKDYKTIDIVDMDLYEILDDEDDIVSVIKNAPLQND